ncbi:hypothetical protein H310_07676 [Aphanomyces invadans]|uniref:Uncharacterized protein n=1 Tax=Aphanomyces invadans TaxID=157072 RepID=A0A024U3V2_9STRA|nr:hypothetical protein H310_07676 [Aphanomyces invadans]ETW00303.1 hypothetical protein H310_07676 [Aphanomyces invadans]|eukprot:XP_008871328.1 hypothetical protein H310_07676 [Aphanomyces invadans]
MTASHQAIYDRMVDILGEGDTQSFLSPLSVDARVRLFEGIGITLNATTQPLEARISQLTEEGRALEESLHQSEGQAATMREHSVALQAEVAQLRDRSRHWNPLCPSCACLFRMYIKLLRWILQVETSADVLCITRESTRVTFALSHLNGQAEEWAYPIRLTNSMSFATFDELVAATKLRFLPQHSNFQ